MNIANTLPILIGSALVIVGITVFNKSYFKAVMTDFVNSKGLLRITGLITFVMGTVIVALHNVWSADWRVLVTLLAWLTAIKGAVIMVFPSSMMLFYRRFLSAHLLTYSGVYALVLGGGAGNQPRSQNTALIGIKDGRNPIHKRTRHEHPRGLR